jgi:hypothetical protein
LLVADCWLLIAGGWLLVTLVPMLRLRSWILVVALVAAACGDDGATATSSPFPEGAFAFSASSSPGVGEERLLVAISDVSGARLATPEIPVTIAVWPEGHEELTQVEDGAFTWALQDVSGLYRANFTFGQPGTWIVEVTPAGGGPLEAFPMSVTADPPTPAIGEPAPRSATPTAEEYPLAEITTDPDPDPRFYGLSVEDAVTSGRPSVIVFATPKFCQTAVCGPTLDIVKGLAGDHPGVNFVHVEVYTNLDDAQNLELVPAVLEWGLPTEPWVFVVDAQGFVVGRFEGVVSAEEITAALSK